MQDILRASGIYKTGYGTVSKLAIFDKEISIGAKGLYCYFCSYAGSGDTAFPYRTRICEELNVSEKTYQSYLRELVNHSYITVEQKKRNNKFSYNVYTIINKMAKQKIKKIVTGSPLLKSVADNIKYIDDFEDIDFAGYGKIPKTLTTDEKVSIKGKAVFGLFAVYSRNGYKKLTTKNAIEILGISEDTYYKILKELESSEYLKRKEIKTKNGYRKQVLVINPDREKRDD